MDTKLLRNTLQKLVNTLITKSGRKRKEYHSCTVIPPSHVRCRLLKLDNGGRSSRCASSRPPRENLHVRVSKQRALSKSGDAVLPEVTELSDQHRVLDRFLPSSVSLRVPSESTHSSMQHGHPLTGWPSARGIDTTFKFKIPKRPPPRVE